MFQNDPYPSVFQNDPYPVFQNDPGPLEIALPMLLSWILAQGRGQPERGAKGKLGMIGPPEIFM